MSRVTRNLSCNGFSFEGWGPGPSWVRFLGTCLAPFSSVRKTEKRDSQTKSEEQSPARGNPRDPLQLHIGWTGNTPKPWNLPRPTGAGCNLGSNIFREVTVEGNATQLLSAAARTRRAFTMILEGMARDQHRRVEIRRAAPWRTKSQLCFWNLCLSKRFD